MVMENPGQEPEGFNPAEKQTQQKSEESTPTNPSPRPKPDAPSSPGREGDIYQEKNYRLNRRQFGVAIMTLIALSIYAGIAAYQAYKMREATDAAQVSAEAGRKAAKTADDTLNLTFRARIAITSISQQPELNDGKQLAVSFDVSNYGPTAARNLKIYRFEKVSLEKDVSRLQYGQQPLRDYPKILAPNKPTSFGIYGENILSPEQISELRNRKLVATFSVLMEYEGDLPGTHHTEACILFSLPPHAWWTYCPWPAQND